MRILVFRIIVFSTFLQPFQDLLGAHQPEALKQADSLFNASKYTESFEVYESILVDGGYTNSMLLKMAFIKEGLGDVSGALYYLNLYYNKTSDKRVLEKMEEIAEANQLLGFKSGDKDFFIGLFDKFEYYIIVLAAVLSLFLLIMTWRQKKYQKEPPVSLGVLYIVSLGFLVTLMNYDFSANRGIINDQDTYLMTGPSAGANVHTIINKGHRVEILGKEGIWIRIKWGNDEVYVRENKIMSIG